MADFVKEWFSWLELDAKWLPKLNESLKNIEIDGRLQKMSWEEKIECLVPYWIEKVTKMDKKVTKSEKSYQSKIQNSDYNDLSNPNEKLTKLPPGLYEKSAMLPSKKLWYVITILMMSGTSVSIDDLTEILSFRHKTFFRENYLKPLEAKGIITKTNPEKPTDPNQKYVITEKGKRFLTGQDV